MTTSIPSRRGLRRVALIAALPLMVTGLATANTGASSAAPDSSEPDTSATADVAEKAESNKPKKPKKKNKKKDVKLQVLSFNDYHGHLEPPTGSSANLGSAEDPALNLVGGAEYLATRLASLREGKKHSITVAAGDLIGGTPFLSGLFHDEPSVETLDAMGLDLAGVGNHEFDEGVDELLRMQHGGCHPEDGCYGDEPYPGAEFEWLSANVKYKDGTEHAGKTVLPPFRVEKYDGVKVAYIGMTLEGTGSIVAASGITEVDFLDEAATANALVRKLKKERGIRAFVVMVHEGGFAPGTYDGCDAGGGTLSDPIKSIVDNFHHEIDLVVTGHTHSPYVCNIPDSKGRDRYVTSASAFGRVVTNTRLRLNPKTKNVRRAEVVSRNKLVLRTVPKDALQTAIIAKWKELADPIANVIVGTISADITRGVTRTVESAMVNVVADAQLFATSDPEDGGAVAALMNPGGVRADLTFEAGTAGDADGEVTYGEAFTVQPFGNLLVTIDLTGAQIEQVLEQQFTEDGTAVRLLLGTSEGFTYTYDLERPLGDKIDPATIEIAGEAIDLGATYRIAANSFLADGGDDFSVMEEGTNRLVWGEDLPALIEYLEANPNLAPAPTNRVTVLPAP